MVGHLTRKSAVPNTDMKVKVGASTVQVVKAEILCFHRLMARTAGPDCLCH